MSGTNSDVPSGESGSLVDSEADSLALNAVSTPERLTGFLPLFSAIGAVLYSLAWLAATSMYGRVQVHAEEVGIGVDFLIVRAAGLAALTTIAVSFALLITGYLPWLRRGRQGDLTPFRRRFLLSRLMLLGLVALLVWRLLPAGGSPLPAGVKVAIALAIAVLVSSYDGVFTLTALGFDLASPDGPGLSQAIDWRQLSTSLAIWMVTLALLAISVGSEAGNRIASDREIDLLFVRAPAVIYHTASSFGSEISTGRCALLLGNADGIVVLYRSDVGVIRVPTDQTAMYDPPAEEEVCQIG